MLNKKLKKVWGNLFLLSVSCAALFAFEMNAKAAEKTKVNVMFTHDTHSHLNSFETVFNGEEKTIGGFSRIKTILDDQRQNDPETLVVDAGDFSMGTLFQTVYEEDASELRMLGTLGFDATTLGNHEFDYRTDGLCAMLETAENSGDILPQMVLCNVDWSNMTDDQKKIKDAFDSYGVKDYTIVEKNGVKIALIGVFGKDSLACAPTCALNFKDPVEAVKNTVEEVKSNEDADMIVLLSHSGTSDNPKNSEDEILAKEVPEIDLIISGHSHTTITEPIRYGDTAVVSCGEYGEQVGSLSMVKKDNGRWDIENYNMIPVTQDIEPDAATQDKIDGFEKSIDEKYLSQFGYTADEVVAHNKYDFDPLDDLYFVHTEHNLGDIIADAYVHGVESGQDYDGVPVDVAVVPSGTIRDTYVKGDITVSDVFNSFSLGIGPDGVPGYPIISVYFTGKELKTMAEIDASVSEYMNSARLYMNGLNFTYNPNRMLLNRVTDVYLTDGAERKEIEDDKLYRVVADLYSGQMLSAVNDQSYGLLSVVPKNADGTPVQNMEDCIVYEDGKELKAWTTIASYMQSFDVGESQIAEIPAYYNELHDRKVVDDSKNIVKLVQNPNRYTAIFAAVFVVAIFIIVCMIKLIVWCVKKTYHKNQR